MRLVIVALALLLGFIGAKGFAEPIVGAEYRCGSTVIYFGRNNVFYNAPGVYEDSQMNTSIVEAIGEDRFRFRIPYGVGWQEVRELGCGSPNSGICEREYGRAELDGDSVRLSFKVETEFYRGCGNLNDCGAMQVGIFFTLRDNRIQPKNGYVATFEDVTTYRNFNAQKDYYFRDNLGNSFHNNMYRHLANRSNWTMECSS